MEQYCTCCSQLGPVFHSCQEGFYSLHSCKDAIRRLLEVGMGEQSLLFQAAMLGSRRRLQLAACERKIHQDSFGSMLMRLSLSRHGQPQLLDLKTAADDAKGGICGGPLSRAQKDNAEGWHFACYSTELSTGKEGALSGKGDAPNSFASKST